MGRIILRFGRCAIGWCNKDRMKIRLGMTNEDWEDLDARDFNTIWLCLEDDVLFKIVGEETQTSLWRRMESVYMTKGMTNEDQEDPDARDFNTIWLCLEDDVLFNIVGEETTT